MPKEKQYYDIKGHAKERGIAFNLTYEEWKSIWIESGHYGQWGKRRNDYCLSRYGDRGAYEVGNVRVLPCHENLQEQWDSASLTQKRNHMETMWLFRDRR